MAEFRPARAERRTGAGASAVVAPPPPAAAGPVLLQAGRLSAELHGVDLRYVRVGALEIVRRLQVVVRDGRWRTVPARLGSVDVRCDDDAFEVRWDASYRLEELELDLVGTIRGDIAGRVSYAMDAVALRPLTYCRIGLVVLHPPRAVAGRPFRAHGEHGPFAGVLPELVGPVGMVDGVSRPLFEPFDALDVELEAGATLVHRFTGDLFEIEDQRNWADASLKTYSTPIARGFPHDLEAGGRLAQDVAVDASALVATVPEAATGPPTLSVRGPTDAAVPPIGLCLDAGAHTPEVLERLRALRPGHLRVDLRADDPDAAAVLARAMTACRRVRAPIELAVHATAGDGPALAGLRERLRKAPLARVLVLDRAATPGPPGETTSAALVRLVRDALGVGGDVPVGGGTARGLCELNRTRPDISAMDLVVFGTDATFHEDDDLSLVETLEAQGDAVRTARAFAAPADVIVSPVRLVSEHNPRVLQARRGGAAPGTPCDPRYASALLAAWTVGSVKHVAEAGAAAITLFDVTGPGGVLGRDGVAHPVLAALDLLVGLRGLRLSRCDSSDPLQVVGLAVRDRTGVRLVAANLTPEPLAVRVEGLGPVRELVLDPHAIAVTHHP